MRIKKKLILTSKIIIKERLIIQADIHFNQGTEIILKKKDNYILFPFNYEGKKQSTKFKTLQKNLTNKKFGNGILLLMQNQNQ